MLLRLFRKAVSGHGYHGFREQVISALLHSQRTDFEETLATVIQEYSEQHSKIAVAREMLEDCPEQLTAAIEKAHATIATRREAFNAKQG